MSHATNARKLKFSQEMIPSVHRRHKFLPEQPLTMMIRSVALFSIAALFPAACYGFTVVPSSVGLRTAVSPVFNSIIPTTSLKMSDFGSDFASAMPAKPVLTVDERIAQAADETIETVSNALGEGVPEPPELQALRDARKNGASTNELALKVYELMIERGMLYDEEPDTGTLTPTDFNIKENLDIPEVKAEFAHLYKYGMAMMDSGLLTADQVKETVVERLIKRTGLEPEEFDKWLGY